MQMQTTQRQWITGNMEVINPGWEPSGKFVKAQIDMPVQMRAPFGPFEKTAQRGKIEDIDEETGRILVRHYNRVDCRCWYSPDRFLVIVD